MNSTLTLLLCTLVSFVMSAAHTTEPLDFEYNGITLSGVLDTPEEGAPKGIVLILHGDGQTDAVAGKWWYDVRHAILDAGYATYMWDKPGCGKSGGTYRQGRPIQDEAAEVSAAIDYLKAQGIGGSETIGLWGISRAGWVAPVVIDRRNDIAFWMSVSGVDDDETFKYLLEQNLLLEGHPRDSVAMMIDEWHDGLLLSRGGASYEYYMRATATLQRNPFWQTITGGGITEEGYYQYQKVLQSTPLDTVTDLPLYVEGFEPMLRRIDIPVLALFGSMDKTVDWQQTKALYEQCLTSSVDLTMRTFSNCNHNMWQCETGGLYELQASGAYVRCEGFLASITEWLEELSVGR